MQAAAVGAGARAWHGMAAAAGVGVGGRRAARCTVRLACSALYERIYDTSCMAQP